MALLQRWLKKLQDRGAGSAAIAVAPAPPAAGAGPVTAPLSDSLRDGNAALAAGDIAGAISHYRAAVAAAPRDAAARVNLGYALMELGELAEAEASLEQAVALQGGADAHYLLGQARAALGKREAARDSLRAAVRERPDFGFAWRELAVASEQSGDLSAALEAYQEAERHAPELSDAVGGCARLLLKLGRHEEAVAAAKRWAQAALQDWQPHLVQGQALQALGRLAEALTALDRAAGLAPGNPLVTYTRGNTLFALERTADAAQCYEQAMAAAPEWAEPRVNRGVSLDRLGRPDEALACFDQALALQPDHPVALYNRALSLLHRQRVPDALETMARARQFHPGNPDIEWQYAVAHLLAGRLQQAWPAFEARWRAGDIGVKLERHAFSQPPWQGQPLEGKTLLLYPEQGLGDTLQFLRFVPVLEGMGARVLLWLPATLQELAATVSPACVVAARLEDLPAFDYQSPFMSVTLALGTTLDTIPAQVSYLRANAAKREAWARRLGEKRGLRVGLVWSGNAAHQNDRNRSIALQEFAAIAVPGCQFVSLQNTVRPEDLPALHAWQGLLHFGEELASFDDTAALADLMDVVISVDTGPAHLAGALGKPLWLLLPYRPDWRWLLEREDSPWYPTARLFRAQGARQWQPVLARVRGELARRVAG